MSSRYGSRSRPRRHAPDESLPGDDALLDVAASDDIGRGLVFQTACFLFDPSVQDPVVTPRQGTAELAEQVELFPAEPIEITDRIVSGDYDCAVKKRDCFCGEPCCRQQHFGRVAIDFPPAAPSGGSEPEVELPIVAGQTFQPVVVNKSNDIGVAVGAGLVNDAIGAEVQDRVHVGCPFPFRGRTALKFCNG